MMDRPDRQEINSERPASDHDASVKQRSEEETWSDGLEDVASYASTAELSTLLESEIYLSGNSEELQADFENQLQFFYDEPEPLAEFDSELGEPLYEIDDSTFGDLTRELRIDQLIGFIHEASDEQRTQIGELLGEFNNRKLRRWVGWLQDKEWTGKNLLMFLEFFNHWHQNSQWWECWYWDKRLGWIPGFSRYVLTREEAYQWIQQCPHGNPNEIIDESWFNDWESFELWKHGFNSFVSFVRFRFSLDDRMNWRRYLELDDVDEDAWWDDDTQ